MASPDAEAHGLTLRRGSWPHLMLRFMASPDAEVHVPDLMPRFVASPDAEVHGLAGPYHGDGEQHVVADLDGPACTHPTTVGYLRMILYISFNIVVAGSWLVKSGFLTQWLISPLQSCNSFCLNI